MKKFVLEMNLFPTSTKFVTYLLLPGDPNGE